MTATVEAAPVAGTKTAWKLDPSHTLVEFSAKHLMITTVKGRITDIEGIIYSDEKDLKNSSVEATLKAVSLDTRTDQRDQHLRSADFWMLRSILRYASVAPGSRGTSRVSSLRATLRFAM